MPREDPKIESFKPSDRPDEKRCREFVPNPIINRQRLCMTVLLVIIAIATFIAVLSYLAGDRQVCLVV